MPPTRDAHVEARLARRRGAIASALGVSGATTAITGSAHSLAGGERPRRCCWRQRSS